ncbi:hypothetical protein BCT46_25185 [Vibrio sp. 10N.261.46.E8]|nr:hypothetical protein [Vibrio sp. 10N.261.45.E11]OMO38437.1 hypothetical protein BH584_17705 [Vibrio sp. 10N.261.45.E1]PMJ36223.1 hypothetical protein BCU27_23565 [Vibrio sp. 10N.286.45.B6]PML84179.1 hypothetical protein BCT66_17900 [Vibrio sp. 10N.261.49.E11]PMM89294.1 hypothetical protein BCT46_25185 [Vibrio sp. 10N.261.46.E8]PMN78909.1 hypothetical protein BCT22_18370 [Vibrio sp. 10N.261.45.A1]
MKKITGWGTLIAICLGIGITTYIDNTERDSVRETVKESVAAHEAAVHRFALKSDIHDQVEQQFNHCEKFNSICLASVLELNVLHDQEKGQWQAVVGEFYAEFQTSFYDKKSSDKYLALKTVN